MKPATKYWKMSGSVRWEDDRPRAGRESRLSQSDFLHKHRLAQQVWNTNGNLGKWETQIGHSKCKTHWWEWVWVAITKHNFRKPGWARHWDMDSTMYSTCLQDLQIFDSQRARALFPHLFQFITRSSKLFVKTSPAKSGRPRRSGRLRRPRRPGRPGRPGSQIVHCAKLYGANLSGAKMSPHQLCQPAVSASDERLDRTTGTAGAPINIRDSPHIYHSYRSNPFHKPGCTISAQRGYQHATCTNLLSFCISQQFFVRDKQRQYLLRLCYIFWAFDKAALCLKWDCNKGKSRYMLGQIKR